MSTERPTFPRKFTQSKMPLASVSDTSRYTYSKNAYCNVRPPKKLKTDLFNLQRDLDEEERALNNQIYLAA